MSFMVKINITACSFIEYIFTEWKFIEEKKTQYYSLLNM